MKFLSVKGTSMLNSTKNLFEALGFTLVSEDSSNLFYNYGVVQFKYTSGNYYSFILSSTGNWSRCYSFIISDNTCSVYYYKDNNILYMSNNAFGSTNNNVLIIKTQEGAFAYSAYNGNSISYLSDGTIDSNDTRVFFGGTTPPSTNANEILVTPFLLKKVSVNTNLQIISGIYSLYTSCPYGTAFSINGTNLQAVMLNSTSPIGIPYVTD